MRRRTAKLHQKTRSKKPAYLREIQIRYKKKRVSSRSPVGQSIKGARQVVELFSDLQDEAKEKLMAISLDAKLRIICFEVVAVGSVASIYFRPFEAIRTAIAVNAWGLIMVHNHPSGDPAPSKDDKKFTKDLKKITETGGMVLHDHIIIGDSSYYSFAERGLMGKHSSE